MKQAQHNCQCSIYTYLYILFLFVFNNNKTILSKMCFAVSRIDVRAISMMMLTDVSARTSCLSDSRSRVCHVCVACISRLDEHRLPPTRIACNYSSSHRKVTIASNELTGTMRTCDCQRRRRSKHMFYREVRARERDWA